MLERIVEDDQLARAPFVHVRADAQAAARRRDDRQVTDQPRVEQAVMRLDVRARRQAREQRHRRSAGDLRDRHLGQRRHRGRKARGVRRHHLAAAPQVQRAPGGIVQQRIVGQRPIRIALDIRRKALGDGLQFGADRRRRRFQLGHPVEIGTTVEGALRQPFEIEHARLLLIQLAPAEQQVERMGNARGRGGGDRGFEMRGEPLIGVLLERLGLAQQRV